MMLVFLVGLGAGAAAALLYASITSGVVAAILLFYLAPLPIMIAAIGWSHLAGLLAIAFATIGISVMFGFYFSAAFLFGVGLPAWWLGYLALLARPLATNGSGAVEWYPIGRLVLWAAIFGTVVVAVGTLMIATALYLSTDSDAFQAGVRAAFERIIRAQTKAAGLPARPDSQRLIDILIAAIPPAVAVLLTILNLFNLWLACRIVNVSGRLRRPWPDLAALALPGFTPGLLAAALAGSFLPDPLGMLSGVFAASLVMAYAIMGFAVLHAITRGMGGRAFALTGAYAAVIVIGWPILAVSMLGLAESAFNIRARYAAQSGGPPATRT